MMLTRIVPLLSDFTTESLVNYTHPRGCECVAGLLKYVPASMFGSSRLPVIQGAIP
jgi:hypothetical protein